MKCCNTMKIQRKQLQVITSAFVLTSLAYYMFYSHVSMGVLWTKHSEDSQQMCDKDFILDANVKRNKSSKRLTECQGFNKSFESSIKENMKYVENYKFNVSHAFLKRLQLDREGINELSRRTTKGAKIPTFVTAVSENHYREFGGLLRMINRFKKIKYPNLKLVVYNLGLSKVHVVTLQKTCNCDVRHFPFETYPEHTRHLRGFAWKPIIIQTVLQEHDFIMWLDTSIRLRNVEPYFQKAKRYGIQLIQGDGSISVRTHRRLFDTLLENQCLFNYPEVKAGVMLITRSCLTLTYIMRPWVSCALQYGCMDFLGAKKYYVCNKSKWKLSSCHRFDQSVLGIILTRLFNDRRHQFLVGPDFAHVCRGCY